MSQGQSHCSGSLRKHSPVNTKRGKPSSGWLESQILCVVCALPFPGGKHSRSLKQSLIMDDCDPNDPWLQRCRPSVFPGKPFGKCQCASQGLTACRYCHRFGQQKTLPQRWLPHDPEQLMISLPICQFKGGPQSRAPIAT